MGRVVSADPQQQYRFTIAIEGVVALGFTKATGLESEFEVVEYREGGYQATRKLPGIEKTGVATFERGAYTDKALFDWFKLVATSDDFRKTITITEQDRLGNTRRVWNLYEAWVSKIVIPDFDANSSDVSIESLEIQYEQIK